MAHSLRSLPFAALAVLAAAACGRSDASAPAQSGASTPPAATAGAGTVVAEVDGVAITTEELDRQAAGELQRVRDQEYEIRRRALEQMVLDRLVEREAKARGVSRDELLRQEVEQKVKRPTAAEIQQVWEENKHRVGTRTLDELRPQIERSMVQERLEDRAAEFQKELKGKSKVRITLEQPRIDVDVADAPATGPQAAPVTIVEFSDYLCPYCQRAEEVVQKVMKKHKANVRFVHRDFLIGKPRSMEVARAASCAGDQGKFWEYRESLLTGSGDWSDDDLAGRAQRLGLEAASFRQCLASNRHDAKIMSSTEGGTRLGVNATPTFFVNGRRMQGVRTEQQFDDVIAEELARPRS